jgi:quercetin dioxygenase-like cupin family protein
MARRKRLLQSENVASGPPVTLAPGQTWSEGPDDVHVVSRNASNSVPATYLVFMVKDKGAPILALGTIQSHQRGKGN